MPDKNGNAVPGEPGYWRFEKNKSTSADTMASVPKDKPVPKDKAYSKTAVKDMKRDQQEVILKNRNIKFSSKDKEFDLIKKILKSNP